METVKKKISLEPFISRQKSTIPFVGMEKDVLYPNLNWGKIPYSVNFNDDNVWAFDKETGERKRVPSMVEISGSTAVNAYGAGIRKLGKMTFSEIMEAYHLVKNNRLDFPENDDELSDEERIEIEKLKSIVAFVDSKKVIDEPQARPDPCCDPCLIPTKDEPIDVDDEPYYVNDASAFVNICLVQSANIVGSYTFATKDWVPGKRYFEGEKVIYDGGTYKLKEFPDTVEISGSVLNCNGDHAMTANFLTGNSLSDFADYPGLSQDMFADYTVTEESEIVDMGYIYARKERGTEGGVVMYRYYVRPSWGGYYNRYDGNIYFDTLRNDLDPESGFISYGGNETSHWKVADDIISHGEYNISSCGKDVHIGHKQDRSIGFSDVLIEGARWETKLSNFIRRTKTITDSNEELQGKLNSAASTVLDLIYRIGAVKNVDTTNDTPIGDFLSDIEITPDQGSPFKLTPVAGSETDFDVIADNLLSEYGGSGAYVKFQDLDDYSSNVTGLVGKSGSITFRYFIGAELELCKNSVGDDVYMYNGGDKGVVYKDTYTWTALDDTKVIDGENRTFAYLDIDYNSEKEGVVYENLNGFEDEVVKSDVDFTSNTMTEGGEPLSVNFQNADYFMEDYQLGLSFVANNNENVYIDRGNATAFERHMRLSEVDTLDDLENYGNGMFKMKE